MSDESHRELIACEERQRKENFVSNFLKKREQDYRIRAELERSRLCLQQEENLKLAAQQLAFIKEKEKAEKKLKREEKDLKIKGATEEEQELRIRLEEERRERENCPFYREKLSKTLEDAINSSRLQELQLRKEMLSRIPETLLNNRCRFRR